MILIRTIKRIYTIKANSIRHFAVEMPHRFKAPQEPINEHHRKMVNGLRVVLALLLGYIFLLPVNDDLFKIEDNASDVKSNEEKPKE